MEPHTEQAPARSPEETLQALETDPKQGLSSQAVQERLARHGRNELEEKHINPLLKLLTYFWGPIPWMIEFAALLSAFIRRWEDFAIILALLFVNVGVAFWEEYKADNAISALKRNLALKARVLRDGSWQTLPAAELVPGDIVALRLGGIVPADMMLLEGDYLSVDQAALTGESLPVSRKPGDVVYSSSIVKQGEMKGVVTATGAGTYFGRTASLVQSARSVSHFQKAILRIGNFLILTTVALAVLILAVALFREEPLVETLQFVLILTVAAIPVALPAVLSVTMAIGAVHLARMKAIVSRLVSIEEMAGMDMLCVDKTGTLTKGELTAGEPVVVGEADADAVRVAAALTCEESSEDPIDRAVLESLPERGRLTSYEVVHLVPFDPVRKRAEAEVQRDGQRFQVAKGAPQVILELVSPPEEVQRLVDARVEELARRGFRAIGVARTDEAGHWQFLGLLPLFDPPREDSAETLRSTRRMGLTVKMLTGDHLAIAREMARRLEFGPRIVSAGEVLDERGRHKEGESIEAFDGLAEVFPVHKFNIVKELRARGHIVGMTGDGVNDAPALKQADVGVAVSGATDAARAASDLVLTAPGLSVIVRAIEEARIIFERMNSYTLFRIAETIRVLLFMTLTILIFHFYPVTAIMIVLLAIFNDLPIMMIAYDNAPVAPRPLKWELQRVLTLSSVLGLLGVIATFSLLWIARKYLELSGGELQTLIFLKLLVAGHLTIYLTRNPGWFWERPWPNWKLIVAAETTQLVGTLAAVYGWFIPAIGWGYALGVWGYALAWFLINNLVKIKAWQMVRGGGGRHARHVGRLMQPLHPQGSGV